MSNACVGKFTVLYMCLLSLTAPSETAHDPKYITTSRKKKQHVGRGGVTYSILTIRRTIPGTDLLIALCDDDRLPYLLLLRE
jgi:hypothetical protein